MPKASTKTTTSTSRRTLFGAVAAGAALLSGSTAFANHPTDAELIAACQALRANLAAYDEACIAQADILLTDPEWQSIGDAISLMRVHRDGYLEKIASMPALTTAGKQAKASALLAFQDMMVPEWDLTHDQIIAASLARDLLDL